jgi:hypothetical protein
MELLNESFFCSKKKPWFKSPTHMQQPYLWSLQLWSELMTFFTYPLEFQSEIQGRRIKHEKTWEIMMICTYTSVMCLYSILCMILFNR